MDYFSSNNSLTEEIVDIMRTRILKGEYDVDEKFIETKIAKELNVSRTPVREAFNQLEQEGLVKYESNRGWFARGLTKNDFEDVYSVRLAMEQLAIEICVDRISDEEIEELLEKIDMMEFFTQKKNASKVRELNKEFHEVLYKATNSRFIIKLLRTYQEYVHFAREKTVVYDGDLVEILKEHREIYDSVSQKNKKKAKEAIKIHLLNSKKRAELKINFSK